MCKEKKVIYVSRWDGCEDIETEAVVNVETGKVIGLSSVETNREYVNCVGEFVKYDKNNIEQVVFDGYSGTIVSKSNENYHVITIHGINFTVSEELEKEDIHMSLKKVMCHAHIYIVLLRILIIKKNICLLGKITVQY